MKSCYASETLVIKQDAMQECEESDKYTNRTTEVGSARLQFAFPIRPFFLRRWGDLICCPIKLRSYFIGPIQRMGAYLA